MLSGAIKVFYYQLRAPSVIDFEVAIIISLETFPVHYQAKITVQDYGGYLNLE